MRGASFRFPCIFVLNWWSGRCPWKRCLVVVAIFTTFCWLFMFSRSSFQIGFMFTPILGEMTSIFFRWVGSTTNYRSFLLACDSSCESSLVSYLAVSVHVCKMRPVFFRITHNHPYVFEVYIHTTMDYFLCHYAVVCTHRTIELNVYIICSTQYSKQIYTQIKRCVCVCVFWWHKAVFFGQCVVLVKVQTLHRTLCTFASVSLPSKIAGWKMKFAFWCPAYFLGLR